MKTQTCDRDLFLESLNRCVESEGFISAFYNRFLSTSDEVRSKFRNTDFEQQNRMLLRSLRLVAEATVGNPEGLCELRERAETHNRRNLIIKPHLYTLWLSSAIETAREYDHCWSCDIENAWTRILQFAIDFMVRRY